MAKTKMQRDEDDGANPTKKLSRADKAKQDIARANWERYEYVNQRGHVNFCHRARRCEDLYLGGGRQWRPEDRAKMEAEGRYPIEVNEVLDAVNTALGYQINNRVDITLSPKRYTSEAKAQRFSKLLMKVKDDLHYGFYESQMFADGLIMARGYMDLRIYYDENLNGEPGIFIYDPMDVIPDPDAKSYDPDDWADVVITRFLTADEIEADYGPELRQQVEADYGAGVGEEDFGEDLDGVERNRFGDDLEDTAYGVYDAIDERTNIPRYRVVDRQYWKIAPATVAVFPTGDIRNMENANPESIKQAQEAGAMLIRKPIRRIRWTVTTQNVVLHDDWSPYDHFTVIPFFPIFRRGSTIGMVDNLEGPQELLNSSITATNQIVRNTANSGYLVEENSLTNMDTDDLETEGSRNGVVIEYRKGSTKPEKIKPNEVPQGVANLVEFSSSKIRGISGMTDAMRGQGGKNQSGIAAQAQQFAAQLSQAPVLDNLNMTRRLFVGRLIKLLQQTLTEPQVMLITETDDKGIPTSRSLYLNQPDPAEPVDAEVFDVTSGEYDFAITEQPAQITYQNSQYNQALEMRKEGIPLPDHIVVKHSNLADKGEVIRTMAQMQQKQDPAAEAKALLDKARAASEEAKATVQRIEALFSAARTAQVIATNPALAGAADAIAKSAGFVDSDPPPIYPAVETDPGAAPPNNTNPLTPDNPQAGVTAGIENGNPPGGM